MTRGAASNMTSPSFLLRSKYALYCSLYAAMPSFSFAFRPSTSSAFGVQSMNSGTTFVCTRWSGQAAPTWDSSAESVPPTNCSTSSASSNVKNHFLRVAHRAANRRHHLRRDASAHFRRQRRMLRAAEQLRFVHARFDERFRFADDFDRLRVACFGRLAPCDESVLLHQDELGFRIVEHAFGDHLGQREARTDVRHPYEAVAENFFAPALCRYPRSKG